jgi:hypothetical protein
VLSHLLRGITVVAIALSVTSTAKARAIEHCRSQAPRRELVCAQRALRSRRGEEHWIRARHSRTLFAQTTAHYWRARLKFVLWRERVDRRTIVEARARLTTSHSTSVGHVALWLCIHRGEGSWHDTGDPYWGGLQMHPGWGYGTSYYASNDSPLVQMQSAERGFAASGFSVAWLRQQWPNTAPPCLGFA